METLTRLFVHLTDADANVVFMMVNFPIRFECDIQLFSIR